MSTEKKATLAGGQASEGRYEAASGDQTTADVNNTPAIYNGAVNGHQGATHEQCASTPVSTFDFTVCTATGVDADDKPFRAVKIITDTDVKPYDRTTFWFFREASGLTLESMADALCKAMANPSKMIVRGKPAGGLDLGKPQLRRLHERHTKTGKKVPPTIIETHRSWVALDLDDIEVPSPLGNGDRVEDAAYHVREHCLPEEFRGARGIACATSSTGRKGDTIARLRLFFLLDRPVSDAQLAEWAKATRNALNLPIDDAVFRPAQPIYTARPIFEGGVVDPVPANCRVVLLKGDFDYVPIKLDRHAKIYANVVARVDAVRENAGNDWRALLAGTLGEGGSFYEPLTTALGVAARSRESVEAICAFVSEMLAERADTGRQRQYDGRWVSAAIEDFRRKDVAESTARSEEERAEAEAVEVAVRDAIDKFNEGDEALIDEFIKLMSSPEAEALSAVKEQSLITLTAKKAGCGVSPIKADLKTAREGAKPSRARAADWLTTNAYGALPTWIDVDKTGEPKATWANTCVAIDALGLKLRFNEFKHQNLMDGRVNGRDYNDSQLLDHLQANIRSEIQARFGFDPGRKTVFEALAALAAKNSYHPVIAYLDSLQWDGAPRVGKWLSTYMAVESSPLNDKIGELVLTAAVRRIKQPGCKFDTMLVFVGEQGTGRSEGLEKLAGKDGYSSADILTLSEKEVMEKLSGVWIQEIPELAGMRNGDVDHIKTLVSRPADTGRPAYALEPVVRPRTCIFVGTVNHSGFLRDTTGNRRFWPVNNLRDATVDKVGLARDRDQLWAEAVVLEAKNNPLILDEDLWGAAGVEQEAHRSKSDWEIKIEGLRSAEFKTKSGLIMSYERGFYRVCSNDIRTEVLELETSRGRSDNEAVISSIMKIYGWVGPRPLPIRGKGKSCYQKHAASIAADYADDALVVLEDEIARIPDELITPQERGALVHEVTKFKTIVDAAQNAGMKAAFAHDEEEAQKRRNRDSNFKEAALEDSRERLKEKQLRARQTAGDAYAALEELLKAARELRSKCAAVNIKFDHQRDEYDFKDAELAHSVRLILAGANSGDVRKRDEDVPF